MSRHVFTRAELAKALAARQNMPDKDRRLLTIRAVRERTARRKARKANAA